MTEENLSYSSEIPSWDPQTTQIQNGSANYYTAIKNCKSENAKT
jgi:hypothetical protein